MLQRLWLRAAVSGSLFAVVCAGLPMTVSAQTASVINACVNRTSGIVRIVPDGTNCPRNEVAYRWNVQGPAGPAGGTGLTVIAEGSGGNGKELTEQDNHLYAGEPFTADRNVLCSVSVTVGLLLAGGREEPQPSFQIAVRLGDAHGTYPQWGGHFPKLTELGGWMTMSRHRWVDIYTGQTAQFGAHIGQLGGDWLPPWCQVYVQYVCFER